MLAKPNFSISININFVFFQGASQPHRFELFVNKRSYGKLVRHARRISVDFGKDYLGAFRNVK